MSVIEAARRTRFMSKQSERSISESEIGVVVDAFYERVRLEPTIGPIFNERIENWPTHLALLKSFWCSALLGAGTFKGSPLETHLSLPLEPEHFRVWLGLFAQTASELLSPSHAAMIVARSESIARNFQRAIANKNKYFSIPVSSDERVDDKRRPCQATTNPTA